MGALSIEVIRPPELSALLADLGTIEAKLAQGAAFNEFAPTFRAALVTNSGPSGRFASSWAVEALPGGKGMVVTNPFPMAGYVENGTAPHIIQPVVAQFLSWMPAAGGHRVFAKVVHHPGFAGRHVFYDTLAEVQDELWQAITDQVTETLRGYGAD